MIWFWPTMMHNTRQYIQCPQGKSQCLSISIYLRIQITAMYVQQHSKGASQCHGEKAAWLNKNVLRWCLKLSADCTKRSSGGSLFHACGPAAVNEQSLIDDKTWTQQISDWFWRLQQQTGWWDLLVRMVHRHTDNDEQSYTVCTRCAA